jgi:signal transduction histidine kinase
MATEHGGSAAQENVLKSGLKGWALNRGNRLRRDLERVNTEIYKRNLELAQTNKTLALLQAVDSLVLRSEDDLKVLANKLSREVVGVGYAFAAIFGRGKIEDDSAPLSLLGMANEHKLKPSQSARINLPSDLPWFKTEELLTVVNLEGLSSDQIADYLKLNAEDVELIRKMFGLKVVCCVKLTAPQRLVGVLVIGYTEDLPQGLSEFDRSLFLRLSEAVGIAIDHRILFAENQHMVGQLQRSNERLKLLDRTKDDFISMASHQLRTPLTSVKGYVSMVLDGDAGELSEQQRKLLNQSFVSSQRMAYLISDLLNVSRLRTGKFVIESAPCDLSKVIEQEVSQLIETAKSRDLTLAYHKPKHFPALMLDENKLRQVIMNFIDNAIYYTPGGGHIDVYLEDKPESIEFRVVDDGVGVPRSEQHHLFSKFYRAKNAQGMRPDGTGLGIFMAKKVIIAQGGAIIFKSKEGKGSIFGFTFPKSKILPAEDKK